MSDKYRVSDAIPEHLVVVPPSPDTPRMTGAVPLEEQPLTRKKSSDPREYPKARTPEGKPSREEIRKETPRRVPSRQSLKAPERSRQPRSGLPGTRTDKSSPASGKPSE